MVAPKTISATTKGSPGGKKSESSSPEPFQEPDGMMTIDLNKSDDYSKETEVEKAKLKQKAQIRYVTQLTFALGSILLVVLALIVIAFVNKEYHFFATTPIQISEAILDSNLSPTSSPIEDFVNLTKIINQALFRDRLRSGNYLKYSHGELKFCRIKRTVDACCEVFKETDLHDMIEFCTVNDMLNILLEYENDRRQKRQVYEDQFVENYNDYQNDYMPHHLEYFSDDHQHQGQPLQAQEPQYYDHIEPFEQFVGELNPFQQNDQLQDGNMEYFEMPDQQFFEQNMVIDPPNDQRQPITNPQQSDDQISPTNSRSVFNLFLPERTREQILEHITIAPKHQVEYKYEDFHDKTRWPGEYDIEIEEARRTNENADRNSEVHNLQVGALPQEDSVTRQKDKSENHRPESPPLSFNLGLLEDEMIPDLSAAYFYPRQSENDEEQQKETSTVKFENTVDEFNPNSLTDDGYTDLAVLEESTEQERNIKHMKQPSGSFDTDSKNIGNATEKTTKEVSFEDNASTSSNEDIENSSTEPAKKKSTVAESEASLENNTATHEVKGQFLTATEFPQAPNHTWSISEDSMSVNDNTNNDNFDAQEEILPTEVFSVEDKEDLDFSTRLSTETTNQSDEMDSTSFKDNLFDPTSIEADSKESNEADNLAVGKATYNRSSQERSTDPQFNINQESNLGHPSNMQLFESNPRRNVSRSNSAQDDFRAKSKQTDGFAASEDVQSNQQSFMNPCYYPYMNPYMPMMPQPAKVGNPQDSGFLKVVSVSQPRVQNQPMYVLNPAMYYGIPQPQPTYTSFPPNPYLPPSYYPPIAQAAQNPVGMGHNVPVQVSAPGGQYYLCNPIPTPSNNIAGLAGVEVRRRASNLQTLMDDMGEYTKNNKTREANLICPLGEHACLDDSLCIRNHHVCDSEVHCDDSSDEIACSCKERVGKLRLCDGYCDCPLCEDEEGCFGCEETEFSCDDWSRFRRSTCIPISQKCDGIKQCEVTGKDEMDCSVLADHIGNFPLNKISNSVGFLHRNYKGKWYPTCFGTELWAAQVCQIEAGPSAIIPKAHMTLTTDPYDGLFINILPNNEVSLVDTCVQDRAAFVECPPIYCGLRFLVNNPYRGQEVDTSIEEMLNDLERAYKFREHGLERSFLEANTDLGRMENDQDDGKVSRKARHSQFENDLTNNRNLTHEHLEEVVENLEKIFKRRDVSGDMFGAVLKESRVVGGKPSQPAAWPWLVSIYKNGIFHCGGVLINELWVLTASHCVDRYWQYYYEIQAGALRRFSYAPMDQRRWAKIVIPHEFYSKSNLRNDIALMKLSAPVRYNRYVRPICLPSEQTAGQDFLKGPSVGTICTTVGWGATVEHGADPDHMREVEVPILQHCKHKEDSDVEEICAGLSEGGKDACQGDSGGPLMCRNPNNPNQWYLAGVVSHGEGCARPNEPGVYTKVSRYIGWIAENTREDKYTLTSPLQKCPGFICKGTKRCIAKKRRCDRIVDCLLGDDEINCEHRFKEIFKHSRKNIAPIANPVQSPDISSTDLVETVVPIDEFGIVGNKQNVTNEDEVNDEDLQEYLDDAEVRQSETEIKPMTKFEDIYFKCRVLLQVIPIEKRCNKIMDCEDGSDETNCSCSDYIKTTDSTAICDGVTDCPDMSDERNCVMCNRTEYNCRLSQICIPLSKRCDGKSDCPQNEDELNCVSLTNGQSLSLDQDNRPSYKSKGIVTINHQGQWRPFCMNNSSPFANDEASLATVICNLLGFDEYLTFHKYRIKDKVINATVSSDSGKILVESPECDNCCSGLYVSCSNTSTTSTLLYKSLEQTKELYFSPWMVAIYSNGQYKCVGTLLDEHWIVTSSNCSRGITSLQTNYVVAVLGKGKLHLTVKGPYEQVIRISSSISVKDSDIVLLRTEEKAWINRYVQAAHLNARRDGYHKEKCYAVGMDNENKTMFLRLTPLKTCLVGFRCFERKIEEQCKDIHPWSGTIICDSRVGWYPAAVFSEEQGHCGFSHKKKYTSVKFYKNQIFAITSLAFEPIPPPICLGYRCPLGNCIAEGKVCDGISHCHDGDDERGTLCYQKEKKCHLEDNCVCPPTHLKCPGTSNCYPKSSFCDRTNNCGEFEDEPAVCACRNYLKLTNPGKICDGTLNCLDRSDEDPEICSCKLNDFQCGKLNKCVPQEMVCDGTPDCPNEEDEMSCLSLKTDGRERNAGEVMARTAGIWHSGCFDLNYSASQLVDICTKLGFNGSSASQLTAPTNATSLFTLQPTLDTFDVIWLRRQSGNKMRLRLRSGNNPYVKFVPTRKCHRLFIACI